MARVVQRRSNQPYLLIVFVFLFVISAILAVLQFIEADKVKKDLAERNKALARLADAEQLRSAQMTAMLAAVENDRNNTVVRQYDQQAQQLIQWITGTAGSDMATVRADVDKAYAKVGTQPGLTHAIEDAYAKLADKDKAIDDQKRELAKLSSELANSKEEEKNLAAKFEGDNKKLTDQIQDLIKQAEAARQDQDRKIAEIKKEYDQSAEALNKKIAEQVQSINDLQKVNNAQAVKILALENKVRPPGSEEGINKLTKRTEGKVMKVLDQDNICYISRGAKDNIRAGMTFAVYPPTGVPENDKRKGSIVVVTVGQLTSECRIVQQDPNDPVTADDLIGNVAYDPIRTYTFVVEGQFDLANSGKPTADGGDKIKQLITLAGGKIANQLGIGTDFLVLGDEPPKPQKPQENAPPQVWKVYQDLMAAYDHYRDIQATAMKMQIPVLNLNRFLALVGYTSSEAGSL